jgi:hypothetical protein
MEFSNALRTLELLRERGLSAELVEGKVRVRPATLLDDAWRDLIRRDREALAEILALESMRWGPALLPEGHPDLDRDEPPNLLATEPPPEIPIGWTLDDWLEWLRAGGDPRPEMAPRLEVVACVPG